LQQNKYTAKMASAARWQIIGGSAPINKCQPLRRPQIVSHGWAAGARLYPIILFTTI